MLMWRRVGFFRPCHFKSSVLSNAGVRYLHSSTTSLDCPNAVNAAASSSPPPLRTSERCLERLSTLKYPYEVVSTEEHLVHAMSALQCGTEVSLDIEAFCTPEAQSTPQLGTISLVQACNAVTPVVFLFDVLQLSVPVFVKAATPLFEDESILKLFFDCRRDVEALSTQMGLVPKRVLDLQLFFTALQWKLRSVNRRSGMSYVLKNVAGVERQEGDSAVQTAMTLGDRPVWDTRPLPAHFLEYAADDVRHILLLAAFFPEYAAGRVSTEAVERLTSHYVAHYGIGHAVTEEADAQPAQVNLSLLERYIGPGGVCQFCGAKGHSITECFRKQSGNVRCVFCGGVGHTARNCFRKHPQLLKCEKCGQLGHTGKNCFKATPCKHCGGAHRSENCHFRQVRERSSILASKN